MAVKTTKKAETKERNISIKHAHEFKNGNIGFDFEVDGINFYRAVVVNGKDGEFISFPSYESNGKWFKYYYIDFTDEEKAEIIKAVKNSLDE